MKRLNVIELNSVLCKNCGDVLISTVESTIEKCFCSNVKIWGGTEYLGVEAVYDDLILDLSKVMV